jgi:hypothetical protein
MNTKMTKHVSFSASRHYITQLFLITLINYEQCYLAEGLTHIQQF